MFALAILARKIPRMNVVDAHGLILFPSAVYFPLSLATLLTMRVELLRSNLLQLGVAQQVVTDLRLVASLRESLKWHVIYKAWCNLRVAQAVLQQPPSPTQALALRPERPELEEATASQPPQSPTSAGTAAFEEFTPDMRTALVMAGARPESVSRGAPRSSAEAVKADDGAYGSPTPAIRHMALNTTIRRALYPDSDDEPTFAPAPAVQARVLQQPLLLSRKSKAKSKLDEAICELMAK